MKILISNDDGIYARGIRVLGQRLAENANHEVYVVAPDRERSATGHALTLHKPIRVEQVEFEGAVKGAWWTTGTPSDCVKFAVGALLKETPDLVISGINSGANLGSEILYSGTVSAAMEGAILGIPSIAVSLVGRQAKNYETAAEFVARLVDFFLQAGLPASTLLNVNVPNLPASSIKAISITKLSLRAYNDRYEKRIDPRGKVYYWLAGEALEGNEAEGSDVWAVAKQMISVTPVAFNMTDKESMVKLSSLSELTNLMGNLYVSSGKAGQEKAQSNCPEHTLEGGRSE